MKHKLLSVTGILGLGAATALFNGCGGAGDSKFISIGTAPVGGVFYTVGGAISDTLNQNQADPESGWKVTAESTGGSQENIKLLASGDIQFAVSNSSISYFGARGEGDWDKAHDIRVVMTMFPNVAMFITRQDSGITKIADLAGERVTIGPQGAGFDYFVRPIVEAHGLSYDAFEQLYSAQQTSVDYLGDGSIAAAFLGGGVPTGSITSAAATMDILMLPFDPAVKAQLIQEYPFFDNATIPANTYRGQTEQYDGMNVGSAHLITHASISEDLVYDITKAIYENRSSIAEKHKAANSIQPGNVVRNTGVEFHPGSVRYYKEIGIWPEADAASGN